MEGGTGREEEEVGDLVVRRWLRGGEEAEEEVDVEKEEGVEVEEGDEGQRWAIDGGESEVVVAAAKAAAQRQHDASASAAPRRAVASLKSAERI